MFLCRHCTVCSLYVLYVGPSNGIPPTNMALCVVKLHACLKEASDCVEGVSVYVCAGGGGVSCAVLSMDQEAHCNTYLSPLFSCSSVRSLLHKDWSRVQLTHYLTGRYVHWTVWFTIHRSVYTNTTGYWFDFPCAEAEHHQRVYSVLSQWDQVHHTAGQPHRPHSITSLTIQAFAHTVHA